MIPDHTTGPKVVTRLTQVEHKGKGRNYAFGHTSTANEIILVDYGGLEMTVADAAHRMQSGDCIIIAAGTRHTLQSSGDAPVNFFNVNYFGTLPAALANRPFRPTDEALEAIDRLKRLESAEPANAGLAELAACLVTEFVLRLCWERGLAPGGKQSEAVNRRRYRSDVVHTALNLIADQYHRDLTATEVAEAAGTSVSNLRLLLNRETGHGFQAHLHMARVEAAKHLLLESSDNVGMIAARVGYGSTPFFYRVFRRLTGLTPMQYARNPDRPPHPLPRHAAR